MKNAKHIGAALVWGGWMMSLKRDFLASAAVAGMLCVTQAAWAQAVPTGQPGSTQAPGAGAPASEPADSTGINDIVVTATRTGSTQLQKTPLAISAFSADQLARSGVSSVRELVQYTPNLTLSQTSTFAQIYVRGVGSNNVNAGSDPDVTVQVDGVYIARPSGQFGEYLDVERVEVLRGPQGTLYGRNAAGGTINVISRAPTDELKMTEQLTIGNYQAVHEQALLSGPIVTGKLQASVALDYVYHRPYIQNIVPGQPDNGNADHGTVRVQLRYAPTSAITATTRADMLAGDEDIQHINHFLAPYTANGGAPLANSTIGHFYQVALNTPQRIRTRNAGISEDINIELAPRINLRSLTAYRRLHVGGLPNTPTIDGDGSELSLSAGQSLDERDNQFSQEFNISGHASILDFVAGAYYFHDVDRNAVATRTPTIYRGTFPRVVTDSYAGFAQGTAHLGNVGLTAGLRYTRERKTFDPLFVGYSVATGASLPGFPFLGPVPPRHDSALTPKFGVDWQVTPTVLLYASATRGYKSGGFNYAATTALASTFGPESLWSYEAGAKTEFFNRRVRLNVTGFHYDYKNLQVQSQIQPGVISITNAATARINGVEAEFTAKPIPALELTANFAYLDAKYVTFSQAQLLPGLLAGGYVSGSRINAGGATYNASGNNLNNSPRYSGLVAAQYTQPVGSGGSVFLRGEYTYKSRAFFDASNVNLLSQASYGLVNAFAGYNSENGFGLRLFVRNLTQTEYIIQAQYNSIAPTGYVGTPRTYGVTLSKSF